MLQLLAGAAKSLASPTPNTSFDAPYLAGIHENDHCFTDHHDPVTAAAPSSNTGGEGGGGGSNNANDSGDCLSGRGGVFFVACLASPSPGASAGGGQRGSNAVYDTLCRQFNQQVVVTATVWFCVVGLC